MFEEYPKMLYRNSVEDYVIVGSLDEETVYRANGYGDYGQWDKQEPASPEAEPASADDKPPSKAKVKAP